MLKLRKFRILELADGLGYRNQAELADALGIGRQWLSELLNGKATPSTEVLVKMAQLFNCSIDDISDYAKTPALAGLSAVNVAMPG